MRRLFPLFLAPVIGAIAVGILLLACTSSSDAEDAPTVNATSSIERSVADTATFAGGCFWCMEPPFDKIDGVSSTTSGFAGGEMQNPSYRQVASGATKHTETVQVIFDSTKVSYERLLRVYWHNIDPFDGSGQFCDRGSQYRPAIFVHSEAQRRLAEQSKMIVSDRFEQPIAVNIHSYDAFFPAEENHQNYYQKNPGHYKRYRRGCGRDARLTAIWGDAAGTDGALAVK